MLGSMALLTALPAPDARRLLAQYGLELSSIEAMQEGSVNSNFRITCADGQRYFARIYEEQELSGAKAELLLVHELSRAGIPTVSAVPGLDGQLVRQALGKPFALYPWIEGEIPCQASVTPELVTKLGRQLARLHRASGAVTPLGSGRFGPETLPARLDVIEREGSAELASAAGFVREKLLFYQERRDQALPSGVIHSDLFRDNVLWQDGQIVALLDFESASHGPFAYDLMVTALAWCYSERFEPELLESLLTAYHAERPLVVPELDALLTEAALGCLRFATTRMTDYSLRAAPGTQPLRDFRRFLSRLAELEAGVLAAPLERLR